MTVETQTDMPGHGARLLPGDPAGQQRFRLWEVCRDGARGRRPNWAWPATEVLRDIPGYPQGRLRGAPNDGQERYVMDAALGQLNRWARAACPAPPRH